MNRKEEIIFIRDYLLWKQNINFWKKVYKWQTKEKLISNKKYLYNLLNTNTNIKKNMKYSSSWVEHILVAKKYLEPYINDILIKINHNNFLVHFQLKYSIFKNSFLYLNIILFIYL